MAFPVSELTPTETEPFYMCAAPKERLVRNPLQPTHRRNSLGHRQPLWIGGVDMFSVMVYEIDDPVELRIIKNYEHKTERKLCYDETIR